MMKREKENSNILKIHRSNTVCLTQDIQRASTKLVLLGCANKSAKKHHQKSDDKDFSVSPKDFKYCYCMTDGASGCACQNQNRELSHLSNGRKTYTKDNSRKSKIGRKIPNNKTSSALKEQKSSSPITMQSEVSEEQNRRFLKLPHKLSDQELWILSAIPALAHPGISDSQRKSLLSVAKIYTDIRPGLRPSYWIGLNSLRLAPLTSRRSKRKIKPKEYEKIYVCPCTPLTIIGKSENTETYKQDNNTETPEQDNISPSEKDVVDTQILSPDEHDYEEALDKIAEDLINYVLLKELSCLNLQKLSATSSMLTEVKLVDEVDTPGHKDNYNIEDQIIKVTIKRNKVETTNQYENVNKSKDDESIIRNTDEINRLRSFSSELRQSMTTNTGSQ